MGDDCFLCIAGAPFLTGSVVDGIVEVMCAGVVSMGECSGV